MTCLENAMNLQKMMAENQMMEAFEMYYDDNVVVVEPTGETRTGKEAQREAIHKWKEMIKEIHAGGVGAMTSNEETGITCAETWIDATFHEGMRVKMEEVAVQKWEKGKIVHERFYYDVPKQ